MDMAEENVGDILKEKSLELKKMFKDIRAVLEQWKFSVEETKEGMRVELHAVALIKHPKREEKK
jgi:virulence-associated protein VapD